MQDFIGDQVDPERSVSPWSGHRDFVYDLLRWRQPDVIVELGTWYGVSFLAMCQAVVDSQANAELHAIDTWSGDVHMGSYGEEVFATFKKSVAAIPRATTNFHRSTFDQALSAFRDDTIDLLHIDGSHTYDALKNDFESWLPKLAPDGLVLMHDIDPACGFGSVKYFQEEIVNKYPNLSFEHSSGLGVVFPKGTRGWEFLLSSDFRRRRVVYQHAATSRRLEHLETRKSFILARRAWAGLWGIRRRLRAVQGRLSRIWRSLTG